MTDRRIIRIQTPADAVAAAPLLLGFVPTDSLVMLTFTTAGPAFTARADLQDDTEGTVTTALMLLDAAQRNNVKQVLFVIFSPVQSFPASTALGVLSIFEAAGEPEVLAMVHADQQGTYATSFEPDIRRPYSIDQHPVVLDEVVNHDSPATALTREDLVAMVAPGDDAIQPDLRAASVPDRLEAKMLAAWGLASHDGPLDDEELALLLAVINDRVEARDAAWCAIGDSRTASQRLSFWLDLMQRTQDGPWLPPLAALTAFCAWQAGNGALAWLAVDRCTRIDASYSLANTVAQVLRDAVPPSTWVPTSVNDLLDSIADND